MAKPHERMLWPLPETDGPFEYTPVCIPIPNDPQHRQNFLGAILALSRWFNYTRTGDERGKIAADAWLYTLDEAITAVSSANPCCPDGGYQYTLRAGGLYRSDDGGITWERVPDGGNGPWDDYEPSEEAPPLPPLPGSDNACQGAWNAAKVFQAFHVALSPYFVVGGIVALAITSIGAGFAFFLGGGPVAFAAVGSIAAAAIALVSGGLVADDFDEDIVERLACIFNDHIGDDASFTQEQFDAALSEISAENGLIWDAVFLYVQGMGPAGATNAARTQSVEDPNCNSCGPCVWSKTFDFTGGSLNGWVLNEGTQSGGIIPHYGTYQNLDGNAFSLWVRMPENGVITEVSVFGDFSIGDMSRNSYPGGHFILYHSTDPGEVTPSFQYEWQGDFGGSGTNKTFTHVLDEPLGTRWVYIGMRTEEGYTPRQSGDTLLKTITLSGTGENPWTGECD